MDEAEKIFLQTFGSQSSSARIKGVTSVDADPDAAGRAVGLSQDTGHPPSVIYNDLENYERSYRQRLTAGIIENDSNIQGYIDSDPMAARVSADDWGNMSDVSRLMTKFLTGATKTIPLTGSVATVADLLKDTEIAKGLTGSLIGSNPKNVGDALEGLGHLLEVESMKQVGASWSEWGAAKQKGYQALVPGIENVRTDSIENFLLDTGRFFGYQLGSGVGSMLPGAVIGAGVGALTRSPRIGMLAGAALPSYVQSFGEVYGAAKEDKAIAAKFASRELSQRQASGVAAVAAIPMAALDAFGVSTILGKAAWGAAKKDFVKRVVKGFAEGALIEGSTEGLQEIISQWAQTWLGSEKGLKEQALSVVNAALGGAVTGGAVSGAKNVPAPKKTPEDVVQEALEAAKPYLEANREIPIGTHPFIDILKKNEIERDSAAFDDLMSSVFQTLTRTRSPQMFLNLPRQFGNRNIFIPAEVLDEIYKNEVPSSDDNKLGWVPNAEAQFWNARMSGMDIVVPMNEFMAFVDQGFYNEIKEDIRFRESGMTLKEAKAFDPVAAAEEIEAFHGSPHEFEAFSMEAIGTGEGAQSYGYGLYFAENPEVAESYRPMKTLDLPDEVLNNYPEFRKKQKRQQEIEKVIEQGLSKGDEVEALAEHDQLSLELYDLYAKIVKKNSGALYRVRIRADKEDFLDWDKPLDEQSPKVQEALAKIAEQHSELGSRIRLATRGMEGYGAIGRGITRGKVGVEADRAASERLRSEGIPGIKYLDQGSRWTPKMLQDKLDQAKANLEMAKKTTIDPADLMPYKEEIERAQAAVDSGVGSGTYNFVIFDETLIDIIDRNGQALAAARQAVNLKPMAQILKDAQAAGAAWAPIGLGRKVLHAEPEKLPEEYQELMNAVNEWIHRIVPKVGGHVPVFDIQREDTGQRSSGLFQDYEQMAPLIYWSFGSKDVYGTVRHEAIHFLRRHSFITESEWDIVARAARDGQWIKKHQVLKYYADLPVEQQIEEAVAAEFAIWRRTPEIKAQGPVQEIFNKLKGIAEDLVKVVKSVFGEQATADSIFEKIESGEIGARKAGKPTTPGAFQIAEQREKQPELPGTRRLEDVPIARGAATELTQRQYDKLVKLASEQWKDDQDWIRKKALERETKRQGKEWKQNKKVMREQVEHDISWNPSVAAANFFSQGIVPGAGKLKFKPQLDWKAVTVDDRKALPKGITSPGGLDPDDVAPLLGFESGKDMIAGIVALEEARGDKPMRDYLNDLIDLEVETRMKKEYGDLVENIMREAEEHVFGSKQLDLMHEELVAIADAIGLQFTFTKADLELSITNRFMDLHHKTLTRGLFQRQVKNAGRALDEAVTKKDSMRYFNGKQLQFIATYELKLFMDYEKAVDRFEDTAKRLGADKIRNVGRPFVDFGQVILAGVGLTINRTPEQVQEAAEKSGYDTVESFVLGHMKDGWSSMEGVSTSLMRGTAPKYQNMTVAQFYGLKKSIDTMLAVGRASERQIVTGERQMWKDFEDDVTNQIKQLPKVKEGALDFIYAIDAVTVRMEEVAKDLDRRRELGPVWKFLFHPFVEAKHTEYDLQEKLVEKLTAIKGKYQKAWISRLSERVPNDFFIDPQTKEPFVMTRQNMINIMLNFGNKSNIKKFVEGWTFPNYKTDAAAFEARLLKWFDENATKEDWDFVQDTFNIWKDWRHLAEELYYDLGGQGKVWVDPDPIVTKYGTYEGGYFPIIESKMWEGDMESRSKKKDVEGLFGDNYFRVDTANGYTFERTDAVWPVEFIDPLEMIATRMQQVMHDIAYRKAVMQANKFISSPKIMSAIRNHYGEAYAHNFRPWLEAIARYYNVNDKAIGQFAYYAQQMRLNLLVHALGMSIGVLASPDVGTGMHVKWATNSKIPDADYQLALSKSREIGHTFKNMNRDFREMLERNFRKGHFNDFQAQAAKLSLWPAVWASQKFRVGTWLASYRDGLSRGLSDGEAVMVADSRVRELHGSGGIPDLPMIMHGGEGWKALTLFYGYFNAMQNKFRHIPGAVRRRDYKEVMESIWVSVIIGAIFGGLLFNRPKKDETWFGTMARALGSQMGGFVPFAREAWSIGVEHRTPSTPLGTVIEAFAEAGRDVSKVIQGKKVEKPIQHGANVVGLSLGLPLGQVGRTTQFLTDVATGKQQPRTFSEWWWGVRFNQAKAKK